MANPPATVREAAAWAARRKPTDIAELDTLLPKGQINGPRMAARIRAASLVGGDHALDVIAAYSDPEGTWPDQVAREILAAWTRFDRAEFARRVFAKNRKLQIQFAGFLERLDGVEAIPGLEVLTVAVKKACPLEPLAHCDRLWSLAINLAYGVEDLSPIGRCTKLLSLEMWNSTAVSAPQWAALAGLGRLQTLKAALTPESDLGFLHALGALRVLDLGIGRDSLGRDDLRLLGDLVQRGVTIHLHERDPWTAVLPAGLGVEAHVHRGAGKVTLSAGR